MITFKKHTILFFRIDFYANKLMINQKLNQTSSNFNE